MKALALSLVSSLALFSTSVFAAEYVLTEGQYANLEDCQGTAEVSRIGGELALVITGSMCGTLHIDNGSAEPMDGQGNQNRSAAILIPDQPGVTVVTVISGSRKTYDTISVVVPPRARQTQLPSNWSYQYVDMGVLFANYECRLVDSAGTHITTMSTWDQCESYAPVIPANWYYAIRGEVEYSRDTNCYLYTDNDVRASTQAVSLALCQ